MLRSPALAAPAANSGQRSSLTHVVDADDVGFEQGGDARAVPELLLQLVASFGEVADAGRGLDDPVLQQRDPGLLAAGHDVDREPERALEQLLEGWRVCQIGSQLRNHQHRIGSRPRVTFHHASPVPLIHPGLCGSARRFSVPAPGGDVRTPGVDDGLHDQTDSGCAAARLPTSEPHHNQTPGE